MRILRNTLLALEGGHPCLPESLCGLAKTPEKADFTRPSGPIVPGRIVLDKTALILV